MPGDGGCAHNSQGNGKDCHPCDVDDQDNDVDDDVDVVGDGDQDDDQDDDDVTGIRCALRAV